MNTLGPWHLLIIAAFFVMLFGAKRLPEAARSLGRSARIMKSELKGMHDETPKAEAVPAEAVLVDAGPTAAVPAEAVSVDVVSVEARDNGRR